MLHILLLLTNRSDSVIILKQEYLRYLFINFIEFFKTSNFDHLKKNWAKLIVKVVFLIFI